jgi:5,10-methylenetetrahydromethanopterin reductase
MSLDVSVAFPPGLATPDHVALAEKLGYARAWLYDTPALCHDVWMTLARAADRTTRIGLGPAVLVPSLRHPLTNAAAALTLAELAPGRVALAVGAGFTGRHLLGQRPLPWPEVRRYIDALRGLLRGDEVLWDGRPIRLLQAPGYGADRPVTVPVLVAAGGPRGSAVAREAGDGVFAAGVPNRRAAGVRWHALLQFGTVLGDGEPPDTPRVLDTAGPGVAAAVHAAYERGGADGVDRLPGGPVWREAIERVPAERRHLAVHEGHLLHLTERDRAAMAAGAAALIPAFTLTGDAAVVAQRLDEMAYHSGVTEVAIQPGGPDIDRELHAFAAAAGLEPMST